MCVYIYSESNKVTYASIYADLWIDNVCLRKGTYTYIYIHFKVCFFKSIPLSH